VKNGNILSYLLNYPNSGVAKRSSRVNLIYEMALGLEHLHSRDIIHGDFKVGLVASGGARLTINRPPTSSSLTRARP
jgi:serine/threonine protein kinase